MSRAPRQFQADFCYHITTRCNNREFKLTRLECREVFLYALKKAQDKYDFQICGLCIMSNHVHYLLKPKQPDEIPKIMHWLNWYTAMCFNRILNRTGHFWEKRYHSTGFPISDKRRVLNTLRYIHANPKAAGMQQGFFYDFSNYGIYDRLSDDGITQWHPAFLELGRTLEECAAKYRKFCQNYKSKPKPEKRNHWGSKFLERFRVRKGKPKLSPGQKDLWENANVQEREEVHRVAEQFIQANCFIPNGDKRAVPGNGSLKS
jgi:putative transposase